MAETDSELYHSESSDVTDREPNPLSYLVDVHVADRAGVRQRESQSRDDGLRRLIEADDFRSFLIVEPHASIRTDRDAVRSTAAGRRPLHEAVCGWRTRIHAPEH